MAQNTENKDQTIQIQYAKLLKYSERKKIQANSLLPSFQSDITLQT